MAPTTILDTVPVTRWLRRLEQGGLAHGSDLTQAFVGSGVADPEREAGWVLHLLEAEGRIRRRGARPCPTEQQRWAGAGGTFGVRGPGAPEVCWLWEAGSVPP